MILECLTKNELDYFKENCDFTEEELEFIKLKTVGKGKTIQKLYGIKGYEKIYKSVKYKINKAKSERRKEEMKINISEISELCDVLEEYMKLFRTIDGTSDLENRTYTTKEVHSIIWLINSKLRKIINKNI